MKAGHNKKISDGWLPALGSHSQKLVCERPRRPRKYDREYLDATQVLDVYRA